MKNVNRILKSVCTLMMVALMLFSVMAPAAAAESKQTYQKITYRKSGTLYEGDYAKKKFTLQAKSKVKISLLGLDLDTDEGTYGRYLITIKDSNGEVVYKKRGDTGYDNKNHVTPELKKGTYTFVLRLAEAEGFDYYLDELKYCYSLYFMTTEKVNIKKVKVSKSALNMKKGDKKTLTATLVPSYATDEITWSTSNKKIATVSSKGKVTAKALGTATITAKAGKKKGTCKVTVNSMAATVIRKKTTKLAPYITNIGNYKKAKWKSSNRNIATVDKYGTVRGISNGSCNIICTIGKTQYTFKVSVKSALSVSYSYIDDTSIYNEVGLKFTNNTNKDITYVTLNIRQYDNRGYKLSSPYSYYYVNYTIPANSSDVYEFWVNDSTKKVKASITKVWFSDGSTWTP